MFISHIRSSSWSSVIESSPSSWSSTSASLSSSVLGELIELYVYLESPAELKDCVEGRHRRRNCLIVLPSRKQSVADWRIVTLWKETRY